MVLPKILNFLKDFSAFLPVTVYNKGRKGAGDSMNYEGQICRGPMERSSFMLPVEVGCAYNGCKFCTLFKHLKYRELPMEQIEEELKRVSTVGGNPRTVFLGDGNAFGLSTEKLLAIIERVHVHFPGCEGIHMDATVTDISRKSDEDLRRLYEAGVRHLYLGIESGLDDVLAFMNKDHTLEQAYRQIDWMREAGLIYDAHFMTGIAGKGRGIENAEYTAEFFNRTRPSRMINFSMFLHERAALYEEIQKGTFRPADELENLIEERRLLELLKPWGQEVLYDGFHDMIEFRVRGKLPKDKESMLARLDERIAVEKPGLTAFVK